MWAVTDATVKDLYDAVLVNPFDEDAKSVLIDAVEEVRGMGDEFVKAFRNHPYDPILLSLDHLRDRNNNAHFTSPVGATLTVKASIATDMCRQSAMVVKRGFFEELYCRIGYWMTYGHLFVQHFPIKHVTICDRRPVFVNTPPCWHISMFSYYRNRDHFNDQSHHCLVPLDLQDEFNFLRRPEYVSNTHEAVYETPEEAFLHLGKVCVNFARAKARMPRLYTELTRPLLRDDFNFDTLISLRNLEGGVR